MGIFFSQLCCLLRFQNSPQIHLWEGFLLCENFSSFTTPSPGQVSIPNSFVSLFFPSLIIPQFGLLSHVNSLRLFSGLSGPVLTLRNKARASLFSPLLLMADVGVWATSLLGVAVRHVICGFYLFIFPPGYVALWDSKTPHRSAGERVSWCLETYPLLRLLPGTGSSITLLSLFLSFIFVLPPFEDNGLPFWVPGVLCQHLEVVLWYLLNVQVFFQWIYGGESDLPVLFLCHLRTTPICAFSFSCIIHQTQFISK